MTMVKNKKITAASRGSSGGSVVSVRRAIRYAQADKTDSILSMRENIHDSIAYATDDKKGTVTYHTLQSTVNCNPADPYRTFEDVITLYGCDELKYGNRQSKDGAPVLAWHYIQSFEGHVDPVVANEIGEKFAEEMFPNFPVVIGTHTNTENTHNHLIVCAWDLRGHKWHQHNPEYQRAREVSDRLSEEYGLSVLDATRKQKLTRWYDEDGNLHYYEPTDRKNDMLRQREKGEISADKLGSYRNTSSYDADENKKLTNKEIIKRDIDRLLPESKSFEHLLQMLRHMGYSISDKKKNGEWLKYITYQPPTASKGTRDKSLSEDGYYLRLNLEKVIGDRVAGRITLEETQKAPDSVPYFEKYIYGETDISAINDHYRSVKNDDGSFWVVPRGKLEKTVIKDIRRYDSNIRGLIDTTTLEQIAKAQRQNKKYVPKTKEEVMIRQIQESFDVLRFMEKENLFSRSQLSKVMEGTWKQYNECSAMIEKLTGTVGTIEQALKAPAIAQVIEERIAKMKDSDEYRMFEMDSDMAQLRQYRETIKKFKLDTPEGISSLTEKVSNTKGKIAKLESMMETQKVRLTEFDRCVKTLNRIDKEAGRGTTQTLEDYEKISSASRKETDENQKGKDKQKEADR